MRVLELVHSLLPFLLRWKEGGFEFKCAELDAFEINEYLLPHLAQTNREQRETLEISSTIRNADFIVAASDWLSGNFLADPLPTYTHAILNPPYKKNSQQF